jgi:prolyl 4-hydroxylase
MQRIDLKKSDATPTFIGSWMIEANPICDGLINYFEAHSYSQRDGRTDGGINRDIKNSKDISIKPNEIALEGNEILRQYFDQLYSCYKDYLVQWPFLERIAGNLEVGMFNLQRYHAGQHFQAIHTERSSLNTLHRVLAWMTYLNDVEDGGSTYFSHYDVDIKPRKGLTLIWPAEWTHAHKGSVLLSGSKYIITGWMNFPSPVLPKS